MSAGPKISQPSPVGTAFPAGPALAPSVQGAPVQASTSLSVLGAEVEMATRALKEEHDALLTKEAECRDQMEKVTRARHRLTDAQEKFNARQAQIASKG